MRHENTLGDIQAAAIDKEIIRFRERHPDPLTLLKSRFRYHNEIAKEILDDAKIKRVPVGSLEVYLLHKEYAEKYQSAISKLESGGH
jgi:hypothetical protein